MIGIYKITNKISNKVYIGQSKSIGVRWSNHLNRLECGKHENQALQEDYNKFGYHIFSFEILKECQESELLEIEKQYIIKYSNNSYNLTNNAKNINNRNCKNTQIKYIYVNSDIYKQYNKSIGKIAQKITLFSYENLNQDNYIEMSVGECAKSLEITSDTIYRYKDLIISDLRKSDIYEKVEYNSGIIILSFKEKYLEVDLKIPLFNHFYKNITNYNTIKFLIFVLKNKTVDIKVEQFKEIFDLCNYNEYSGLKKYCISKILKDINNIGININFKEMKLGGKIAKLYFNI